MTDLSDAPIALRLFRAISGTLAVAVVVGVVEALIRYATAETTFVAKQLTLASAANVAILGAAGIFAIVAGMILGALAGLPLKKYRDRLQMIAMIGLTGGLAALLAYGTQLFGFADRIPNPLVANLGLALLFATLAGGAVWRLGLSPRPSLMNLTRGCVVLAWILCGVALGLGMAKTKRYVNDWVASGGGPPAEPDAKVPAKPLPSFLVIVLDTLRADRVGGDPSLTPNLDRFAESAAMYDHAISTAPWTLPVHASLLTGLYPDEHGVNWGHYVLDDKAAVLPELLKKKGYASFAVSNNHLLNRENGFAQGFDAFLETTRDPGISPWKLALRCGATGWASRWVGLSADAGWDQGSAWTNWVLQRKLTQSAGSGAPFFSLINYFEPHDPYLPPRRFVERMLSPADRAKARRLRQGEEPLAAHACGDAGVYTADQVGLLNKLYDAEVAYQDERLGEMLAILERTGLLNNTWVIVTSDHGELFGEAGLVYHTASAHYQLLHVPLLVRPPGGMATARITAPVQPVDIFMTVLAKAGVPAPQTITRAYPLPLDSTTPTQRTVCVAQTHGASIAGLSITQRLDPQSDLAHWMRWINTVYRDGFVLETDTRGGLALFSVIEDPTMSFNLAQTREDIVESMMAELHEWSGKDTAAVAAPSGPSKGQEEKHEKSWLAQALGL